MRKIVLLFISLFIAFGAYAAIDRKSRNLKLPTQVLIEKQTLTTPVVADPNRILSAQATSSSVTTTVTTFLAQPDVCRGLSITPGGTTADVPAGDIDVTGLNIRGRGITEAFTLTANQSTIENGLKAFCSVSKIVFPIQDGGSATYDFGVLDTLGLKRCMDFAGHLVFTVFDGAFETTRATCVADADEVEKNTCDPDGTLDGAKDVQYFFLQNFRCE